MTSTALRLSWGGATHQGRVRTNNQDALYAEGGLFVVADGMGGHRGGEVASQVAVQAMSGAGHGSLESLVAATRLANQAVWEMAADRPELKGMGTTLSAMSVIGDGNPPLLAMVNVGDSRVYRYRDGTLEQLTDDHSYVAELVRRGQIDPAEAAVHPYRNMLTRAIGVGESVEVDRWVIEPAAGDRYLLCSDGLVNEVEDSEIAATVGSSDDPSEIAGRLIEQANSHGGRDNITVVVIQIDAETSTASAAPVVETTVESAEPGATAVADGPPPEPPAAGAPTAAAGGGAGTPPDSSVAAGSTASGAASGGGAVTPGGTSAAGGASVVGASVPVVDSSVAAGSTASGAASGGGAVSPGGTSAVGASDPVSRAVQESLPPVDTGVIRDIPTGPGPAATRPLTEPIPGPAATRPPTEPIPGPDRGSSPTVSVVTTEGPTGVAPVSPDRATVVIPPAPIPDGAEGAVGAPDVA
ncbi:MAG TPA: Stp1/IreP family PP2C-type Ser/Thr phosphatase, partial [Acidimicrobiales bacterium]|nr:Stp1/IreP family PP2C-type Ser/Thr phosphatase [Acidimicrobiales bacterium]